MMGFQLQRGGWFAHCPMAAVPVGQGRLEQGPVRGDGGAGCGVFSQLSRWLSEGKNK